MSPALATLATLAPLPAIALGAGVAHLHGVAATAFAPNLVAAAIGALAIAFLATSAPGSPRRAPSPWRNVAIHSAAVGALAATLLAPGLDGVQRWIPVGAFTLHASAFVTPWLLAGLATAPHAAARPLVALLCAAQLIHLAQPDAAQATALALGSLPALATARAIPPQFRGATAGLLVVLAVATWLRPDPVQPVAHVEQIVDLARASGPAWLMASLAATALLFLPVLVPRISRAHAAFGVYLLTALVVPCAGHFPVPILGAGAGHVLGWYAALGVMAVAERRTHSPGA